MTAGTFHEGYHIGALHRKTIAPYFIGNCGTFDGAGLHGRMCVARTSIEQPTRNWSLPVGLTPGMHSLSR